MGRRSGHAHDVKRMDLINTVRVQGLRSETQAAEIDEMQQDNLKESIGVDAMKDFPAESDIAEGEVKGSMQPKIAGLEGIEFDTGNS